VHSASIPKGESTLLRKKSLHIAFDEIVLTPSLAHILYILKNHVTPSNGIMSEYLV
jgi:hypothetical protein